MIVDIHAHYVARELIAEAKRNGARYRVQVRSGPDGSERLAFDDGPLIRPFFPELCDLEVRLRDMDRRGVDVQAISTWMDIVGYWLPPDAGRRWMRLQNETIAQAARQHPERLWPMGTLPLQDVPAALEELDYCVRELGMRALEIGTSIGGHNLDEPRFRPFWARVHELEVLVFLHPPLLPMAPERLDGYFLTNLMGNPMETTVAASRLIFGGVLDAFPRLKCCLAHAGGFLPYQIGRLDRGYDTRPECRGMAAPPSAYLQRFYYDTIAFDDRALAYLLQVVSSERVLFGSDYPFPMSDPRALTRVQEVRGLDEAQRRSVLGGTACTVMNAE